MDCTRLNTQLRKLNSLANIQERGGCLCELNRRLMELSKQVIQTKQLIDSVSGCDNKNCKCKARHE